MKIELNWNSSFDSDQSFEKAVAGAFLIHSTKVLEPKIPGWSGWGTHDMGNLRVIDWEHLLKTKMIFGDSHQNYGGSHV